LRIILIGRIISREILLIGAILLSLLGKCLLIFIQNMLLWSGLVEMLLSSRRVWCKNSSIKLKRPSGSLKVSWDLNYIHFQAWDSGCSSSYTSTFACQLSLKRAKKLDLKKQKNLQTPETFMQILICTHQKGKKVPSWSWLCKCILVLWNEPRYIAKATGVAYTCCCVVKPKMAVRPAEARGMITPNLLKKIREILTYLRCTKPIHICLAFSCTGETERVSKTHLYLLRAYMQNGYLRVFQNTIIIPAFALYAVESVS